MADETFDLEAARTKHDDIIREVQRIRDGINKDVIEYYYSKYPQNEDDEKYQHDDMRKYLKIAHDRIGDLLNGKLY